MREKQLPVNENVFNALIMGHSNADDIESAAGILGVMSQAGLEPSADTYTTLLCGYARKGDIDSINKYIELCDQKEIHLLDKDFLEVAYALSINGHDDKLDCVLDKLKKSIGYNQDAVNVILRLINKGRIESAMNVLKTMPRTFKTDGEQPDTGSFLIKQMIKADRPIQQILTICEELENTKMHTKPVLIALEEALKESKGEIAKSLLVEMKKKDVEIRQHYFWPLIASAKSEKEAFEVASYMMKEFQLDVSGQTIREYLIPKLENQNYENMVHSLRNLGISTATACTCAAFTAIKRDDLASAARIMNTFDAYFSPGLFRRPLLFALTAKRDFNSYVKILRSIHDGVSRLQNVNSHQAREVEEEHLEGETLPEVTAEAKTEQLQAEILGSFVIDAVMNIRTDKLEATQKILEGLVAQGLSITNQKAEIIQTRIGEQMTTELSSLLSKLTSGELEPIHVEKRQSKGPSNGSLKPEVLEFIINRMEEKGENTKGMKKQLLIQSIRSKDIEKTEQIMEKLKGEGYTLTNGVYALLLELYATHDNAEEAMKIYNQIKGEDNEFKLDDTKIIKMVQAFVNNGKVDEAIKFLEENKREAVPESTGFPYNNICWRALNTIAEKENVEELEKLFNALISNNFVLPNNVILGPLIKVHVLKGDMKAAVDKFEEICTKYRATPWKNELSCKLIQAEDAANLQRITDLSTDVHGEVNSLYDLVFSFIECGRIRQARKILETPGLRVRAYNRISYICERYAEEGKPVFLEGLAEATKDLNHIDRSEIFYNLMQTYIKEKSVDKCLEIWTKMQEEDISPSDALLIKLANFLKSENVDVPFVIPEEVLKQEQSVKTANQPETKAAPKVAKTFVKNENRANKEEDLNAFIANADNLKQFSLLSVFKKSRVIEALIQNGRINEANKFVLEMLDDKIHPRLNVFRFYLNKLALSGDTESMDNIGKHLDSNMKKELSFDNRYCHGFVSKGKTEDYLQRLETIIDDAKTAEDIQKAGESFPRGNN